MRIRMLIQVIKVMWIHAILDADPDPQHWFPYPTIPFTDVLWTIGQLVRFVNSMEDNYGNGL